MLFDKVKSNRNPFIRILKPGCFYSCGYYSQNCWVDDDRLVLLRVLNPLSDTSSQSELVLIDLASKTEKVLVRQENTNTIPHIVFKNTIYFVKNDMLLCSIDADTLEVKEIFRSESEPIEHPHITADGRYLNWFFEGRGVLKDRWICWKLDLKSGKVVKMLEAGFVPPFKAANHFMLCPTDPDILFFAHEGDTTYITNRLWIAESGKTPYNIAKQRLDENGNLMDCFGHESWAPDGKGLYFVKYACSPEPPVGIGYVDLKTRKPKILYTENKYWHVCAAPNGRYLAADLAPTSIDGKKIEKSGVCLIDTKENTEKIIVDVHSMKKHPGHPHPQFNPSCTRICFHDALDDDTLSVGIIDI